jgi:hypothetical protein
MIVGNMIKEIRENSGLSQEQFVGIIVVATAIITFILWSGEIVPLYLYSKAIVSLVFDPKAITIIVIFPLLFQYIIENGVKNEDQ